MKQLANGVEHYYQIQGDGPPLVLIHGWGDTSDYWKYQLPALSTSFRVVTYDVRGFGRSQATESGYTFPVFAEDLRYLLKALAIRSAAILGYSMGGRIAIEFAMHYPEMVNALVLSNVYTGEMPPKHIVQERLLSLRQSLSSPNLFQLSGQFASDSFSPQFRSKNPERVQEYARVKSGNNREAMLRMTESPGLYLHSMPDTGGLHCPVLLIFGEYDTGVPEPARQASRRLFPSAREIIIPTGHASAMEMPDEFNRVVLEFLAGANDSGR